MKKMCIVFLSSLCMKGNSQVVLSANSPVQLLDFSAAMPVSAGTSVFTCAGFEPDPIIAGRLNSNAWSFSGWSDGSLSFGGTRITASTDYTRGSTQNAVSTGGIYAYSGAPAFATNPILLFQPGGADWAPGSMTLKIRNGSTIIIQSLTIQYDLYVRNDQGRSSSFLFSHSANDINYLAAPSLDYFSPAAPDANGLIHIGGSPSRNLTISGLTIAPGGYYYLRWNSEDNGGSGSRDEFGIDNILVSADFTQSPLPVSLLDFRVQPQQNYNLLSWKTVFEQNNRGFELQRSENGIDFQTVNFIPTRAWMGNSQDVIFYSTMDSRAQHGTWYYRLRQIDMDGPNRLSQIVVCRRSNDTGLHIYAPFPNPFINEFLLAIRTDVPMICFINVWDMMGHKILEKRSALIAGLNNLRMDAGNWPHGQYSICIFSANGSCVGNTTLLK